MKEPSPRIGCSNTGSLWEKFLLFAYLSLLHACDYIIRAFHLMWLFLLSTMLTSSSNFYDFHWRLKTLEESHSPLVLLVPFCQQSNYQVLFQLHCEESHCWKHNQYCTNQENLFSYVFYYIGSAPLENVDQCTNHCKRR